MCLKILLNISDELYIKVQLKMEMFTFTFYITSLLEMLSIVISNLISMTGNKKTVL